MLSGLSRYDRWVPLLLRIGVGLTMFFAGLSKVTGNMAGLTQAFGNWGIPMPGLMAPFISYLELIGGIAVLLGLGARLFGLLFAIDMMVAILAAKWPMVVKGGGFDFSQMRVEWLLLLGGLSLMVTGAGALAIDRLMARGAVREGKLVAAGSRKRSPVG